MLSNKTRLQSRTPLKSYTTFKTKKTIGQGSTTLTFSSFKVKPKKWKKQPETPQQKLDRIFSEYIRRKHADKNGSVICVTCGAIQHWKKMQNGHFKDRAHMATRYNEKNCHVQCETCNCFEGGKHEVFARYIDYVYGIGTADELTRLSQTIVHNFDYPAMIEHYEEKLYLLKEQQDQEIQY